MTCNSPIRLVHLLALSAISLSPTCPAHAQDWEAQADTRIEQLRMADFEVRVTDPTGQPVMAVPVDLRMRRHAFPFGTAVNFGRISQASEMDADARLYEENLLDLFNTVVWENAHKWKTWEAEAAFSVNVFAEATAAPAAFTQNSGNLSSRPKTQAEVPWTTESPWTSAQAGNAERSPDLTPIVQELVDRPDWTGQSDAIALIFSRGSGKREAFSLEPSGFAPRLRVLYDGGGGQVEWIQTVQNIGDAAEEKANSSMDLTSGDLDLADKWVGLRFTELDIPPGSEILEAHVQFVAQKTTRTRETIIEQTQWLFDQDLEVRGHTMFWQNPNALPPDISALRDDPTTQNLDTMRTRIFDRVDEIGTFYQGLIKDWDVVNEQPHEHELTDLLDPGAPRERAEPLEEIFQRARTATTPNTQRFVNDFGRIHQGSSNSDYFRHASFLADQGVLEGVGFQAHLWQSSMAVSGPKLWELFDKYAALGVRLKITEFDMYDGAGSTSLQAEFLHRLFKAAFAHEAMDGILFWGFWDGSHWKNNAMLFNNDWSLKPAGQAYRDLVFNKWWTDNTDLPEIDRMTDGAGHYATRGFKGAYEARAEAGGKLGVARGFQTTDGDHLDLEIPGADEAATERWRIAVSSRLNDGTESTAGGTVPDADTLTLGGGHTTLLRFRDLPMPEGMALIDARLRFVAAADNDSSAATLNIRAQRSVNPSAVGNRPGDLLDRPLTETVLTWANVAPWTVADESGGAQTSPDIGPVLRELIDAGYLEDGGDLALSVSGQGGSRSAWSFDGHPSRAPVLLLSFAEKVTYVESTASVDWPDGADTTLEGDVDQDSRLNGIEFVLGSSPVDGDTDPALQLSLTESDGQLWVAVEHTRNLLADGLEAVLQYSYDLAAWDDLGPGELGAVESRLPRRPEDPGTVARRQSRFPAPTGADTLFLRVTAR
ncbi:MAG: hypothetical protein GVY36_07040 [Verrucomicrobia bacterium]|jgi:GH35 family endo-1,4-beta-xylanase|nr:hypothetical protein [Verrucomicrobiota bacterium]